jgi:ATP-binding cassette subfamily C (CFTR/MRP) protein 1
MSPSFISPVVTFAVYKNVTPMNMTVASALASLSLITLINSSCQALISQFPGLATSYACFQRLDLFLNNTNSSEREGPDMDGDKQEKSLRQYPLLPNSGRPLQKLSGDSGMLQFGICNGSLGTRHGHPAVLTNVNLNISKASLTVITGPVGSGKSLLLKSLCGEVLCKSETCYVPNLPIAYCSQTPWLRNGTIKDNIVGPKGEYDAKWYSTVLDACALLQDLDALPAGDQSLIGSKAANLSGGQQQRIVSDLEAPKLPKYAYMISTGTGQSHLLKGQHLRTG